MKAQVCTRLKCQFSFNLFFLCLFTVFSVLSFIAYCFFAFTTFAGARFFFLHSIFTNVFCCHRCCSLGFCGKTLCTKSVIMYEILKCVGCHFLCNRLSLIDNCWLCSKSEMETIFAFHQNANENGYNYRFHTLTYTI